MDLNEERRTSATLERQTSHVNAAKDTLGESS
jgi:hypothetical protein